MIKTKSFVQKLNNFCPFERKCTFPPRLPAFYETAIKNADFPCILELIAGCH